MLAGICRARRAHRLRVVGGGPTVATGRVVVLGVEGGDHRVRRGTVGRSGRGRPSGGVHVVNPGVIDTELFPMPDNDESLADIEALPADGHGRAGARRCSTPPRSRSTFPSGSATCAGGQVPRHGRLSAGQRRLHPPAVGRPRDHDLRRDGLVTRRAIPLALLSPDEVTAAREALHAAGELPDGALVAHIVVHEPRKDDLAAWSPGDPVPRVLRALVVPGPELTMVELLVDVGASSAPRRSSVARSSRACGPPCRCTSRSWRSSPAWSDADYVAALAKRGHRRPRPPADRPVAGRVVRLRRRGRTAASPDASPSSGSPRPTTATPVRSKG